MCVFDLAGAGCAVDGACDYVSVVESLAGKDWLVAAWAARTVLDGCGFGCGGVAVVLCVVSALSEVPSSRCLSRLVLRLVLGAVGASGDVLEAAVVSAVLGCSGHQPGSEVGSAVRDW